MIYAYKCTECDNTFDLSRMMEERNDEAACPMCAASSKRYYTPISHSFLEGHSSISNKPDSYWENAERVKKSKIAQRYNEQIEKSVYNDTTVNPKFRTIKDHVK